ILHRLVDDVANSLGAVGWWAAGPGREQELAVLAVAALEDRGVSNLTKLAKEIKRDALLLSVEKTELLAAVAGGREQVLKMLKGAVWGQAPGAGMEKSPMTALCLLTALVVGDSPRPNARYAGAEIEAPFDKYLLANPLLMDVTGAKVIRLQDGHRVVLAVA